MNRSAKFHDAVFVMNNQRDIAPRRDVGMAAMKLSADAKRCISAGSASTTSRGVTAWSDLLDDGAGTFRQGADEFRLG